MVVIVLIAFFWLMNWLFSCLLIFLPTGLWHGLESLLWYGILGIVAIALSWFLGKS